MTADAAASEVDARELAEKITPLGSRRGLAGVGGERDEGGDSRSSGEGSVRVWSGHEQAARRGELAVDVGGGEQAEVADLDEAAGQDVEQEAADEFVWR